MIPDWINLIENKLLHMNVLGVCRNLLNTDQIRPVNEYRQLNPKDFGVLFSDLIEVPI